MKKKDIRIKHVIVGLCILLAGIFYTGARTQNNASLPAFETVETLGVEAYSTAAAEVVLPHEIVIHVCGEVKNPGVYRMEEGSRIYEALEQAGGFTDKAAPDFLNMAQILEDGMKLTVPDEETVRQIESNQSLGTAGLSQVGAVIQGGSASAGNRQSDKVNINTASKEQLMTLKGIGEARAEDIISHRERSGSFQTIEDIMKVSGIKEAAFQKIKENITV